MRDYLIVFDINHTLVGRYKQDFFRNKLEIFYKSESNDFDAETYIKEELKKGRLFEYYDCFFYRRQYTDVLKEFLESHNLNYAIWSTTRKDNLEKMETFLQRNGISKYIGAYSQEECTVKTEVTVINETKQDGKQYVYKGTKLDDQVFFNQESSVNTTSPQNLSKFDFSTRKSIYFKNLEIPANILGFDVKKCVLVEDCPDKRYENQNYISIKPPTYFKEDFELVRISLEIDKFIGCHEDCYIKRKMKEFEEIMQ